MRNYLQIDCAILVLALIIILISSAAGTDWDLHMAARKGDAQANSDLIGNGHEINNIGPHGMTPLIHGTYYGYAPTMCKLLELGADLDIQDDQEKTALHYAAEYGRPDIVKILLDVGADPNIEDIYGKTAAMSSSN